MKVTGIFLLNIFVALLKKKCKIRKLMSWSNCFYQFIKAICINCYSFIKIRLVERIFNPIVHINIKCLPING